MSLSDIRAKHMKLIRLLYDAMREDPQKMLKYSELIELSGQEERTLCRNLEFLRNERILHKFINEGQEYYTLAMFGEAIIEIEKYPGVMFFFVLDVWESIHSEFKGFNANRRVS